MRRGLPSWGSGACVELALLCWLDSLHWWCKGRTSKRCDHASKPETKIKALVVLLKAPTVPLLVLIVRVVVCFTFILATSSTALPTANSESQILSRNFVFELMNIVL